MRCMEVCNMFKKDDAVSPVIGVILMVAITVILAAVIAAFVFGMAGNVNTTKNVAFVSELKGPDSVVITNHGGNDVSKLNSVDVIAGGDESLDQELTDVGDYLTFDLADDDRRVIIKGHFDDGSESILLDRTY